MTAASPRAPGPPVPPPGLPARPRLLPGVAVARRDAHHLQVGLDERAVVLPDHPEVRRALAALQDGSPVPLAPRAAQALARLDAAGLVVDGADLRRSMASYAAGPVARAALAATWCSAPGDAEDRWAARSGAVVSVEGPPTARAALQGLLGSCGLAPGGGPRSGATGRRTAGRPAGPPAPDVVVVVAEGQPDRAVTDAQQQRSLPHLVVHGDLDHVVVGPFVVPGRTACLRCVDAHLADRDPRRPLVLEQQPREGALVPLDPVLWQLALAWAARDVLRWVEGEQPSTWSTTVRVGPDLRPRRREWLRHPHCGCGWDALAAHQCSESSFPSIERRCSREQDSQ